MAELVFVWHVGRLCLATAPLAWAENVDLSRSREKSCLLSLQEGRRGSKKKKLNIRSASGRMRRDTLLSPGRLALPPFPPPPFTFPPGARPIISGMHGCGGWLGLVLYIGPGWGYGGGPRP
eukprot:scaffold5891_cov121-Isochrysis_galbana.AAC.1